MPKGDPLALARVAATQAAKETPRIAPYCHPIAIEFVGVEFDVKPESIEALVTIKTVAKTGVEVEAMTAAAVAALNLYDLLKPLDTEITIESIRLLEKRGGKGDWGGVEPFAAVVITVSDSTSRGERQDASGPILREGLSLHGAATVRSQIVADDQIEIAEAVRAQIENGASVVLLTGGTGVGPRDVTPQAIEPLLSLRLPGVEEQLRSYGRKRVATASLSRSMAGIVNQSLVIALPGSPKACQEGIAALFPWVLHAIPMLAGGGHDPV